tara:strand:- start:7202 stop:7870 length:669 start_codon:yes stop_codon:yes gene_type:complete
MSAVEFNYEPIVIHVRGEIDDDMISDFSDNMQQAARSPQTIVPIVIQSNGGDVYTLMHMLAMVETLKKTKKVATVCMGQCFSAAAVLFTEGTDGYRYMHPNATMMIHDIAISDLDGNLNSVVTESQEMTRLNNILYERMAKNCGKFKTFFKKKADKNGHTDMYITADTALEWNLTNHVRMPTFKMRVQVMETVEGEFNGESVIMATPCREDDVPKKKRRKRV